MENTVSSSALRKRGGGLVNNNNEMLDTTTTTNNNSNNVDVPAFYFNDDNTTTRSTAPLLVVNDDDTTRPFSFSSINYIEWVESDSAIHLCLVCIVLYMLGSVLFFTVLCEETKHSWSTIDALYFAVVTFTTIGYGDFTPKSTTGKLFTIAFVIFGILIVGVAFGILGEKLLKKEKKILNTLKENRKQQVYQQLMVPTESVNTSPTLTSSSSSGSLYYDIKNVVLLDIPMLVLVIVLTIGIGKYEGWSILDCIYYLIITTTTVGYGDIVPTYEITKFVSIFLLPLGVIVLTRLLGNIASMYISKQSKKQFKQMLSTRKLSLNDLIVMDTNLDGQVTYDEFLSFMLIAMRKVDQETMDELKDLFNTLDANKGGTLDKEDLILLEQQKQQQQQQQQEQQQQQC